MSDWQAERERMGRVIATLNKLKFKDGRWLVPSSSGSHHYKVDPDNEKPDCTCMGFIETSAPCVHIFAARYVMNRKRNRDGSVNVREDLVASEADRKRRTYPQNWPAYNAAQVNEKPLFQSLLADLCATIEEPPHPRGRPPIPLADMVFAMTYKVYSGLPSRRFISDLNAAHDNGCISRKQCFNSVLKHFESPKLTTILQNFIVESSRPFSAFETVFAVDSTGFTSGKYTSWRDRNQRNVNYRERNWVKLHVMCGVESNVVTAAEIRERDAGDSPVFPSLYRTTEQNFNIKDVCADRAYQSYRNFRVAEQSGATAFIPFKKGSRAGGGHLWTKMFHLFHYQKDEFLARYHKRSNVETTFSMMKAKFRSDLRHRTEIAMKNEVYAKVLAHNICRVIHAIHEDGMIPDTLFKSKAA